ncbi:hypothetical protein EI42_00272 [Thermosporothrix hazakensis]|jgi:hypothetical protein|uniref:HEAT repeat protein n=2 Tax=Thermosporothrix TaxID=768650 RepID=A0A326UBV8_THEHA|nr:hypothetical protein [Thermosporothrix hazakensis]PZW36102.1 hypothetical protein EI42_00272 [Thermosporothrix hazakensis]BBH88568.1 hypothetical protein KTC_33190 [Thermosporothrix sp. COM3]GCE46753.1 hypothetical protein KTH_16220 [Thermosporothrix hazakensis]
MHDTLAALVERALTGNHRPLEFYLRDNSRLPGPRANLELADDVSNLLASFVSRCPDNVRSLLHYFVNGERKMVTSNSPSEFLMLCGIIGLGVCASVQPDWREETFMTLDHYACSPCWRVREGVAIAFQHLLQADTTQTLAHLQSLAETGNWLQQRAAIAAVAEPILLKSLDIVPGALQMQRTVLERVRQVPEGERKQEEFRTLRRSLAYTLSVVTAAAPADGFALMRECASWHDAVITWILRENLKKKRLAKYANDAREVARLLE